MKPTDHDWDQALTDPDWDEIALRRLICKCENRIGQLWKISTGKRKI